MVYIYNKIIKYNNNTASSRSLINNIIIKKKKRRRKKKKEKADNKIHHRITCVRYSLNSTVEIEKFGNLDGRDSYAYLSVYILLHINKYKRDEPSSPWQV